MNFLAHLYLSGDNDKIMVGNFIGDFVRGRNLTDRFEPEIVLGIELHRAIDEFTDKHALVQQSKNRLRPKYRHYSPVIVDVFYDHFLASKWNDYHPLPLSQFASRTYELMQSQFAVLPREVNWMLPYMIKGNWLLNYSKVEGIRQALSGMAKRTPYVSRMDEATGDLELSYTEFLEEFVQFFPILKKFAQEFIIART